MSIGTIAGVIGAAILGALAGFAICVLADPPASASRTPVQASADCVPREQFEKALDLGDECASLLGRCVTRLEGCEGVR